jgi:membrane protein implicated in regulation of membrane protease activity
MFLIVALVLFLLLPDPWNLFLGTASLVLFVGELSFWNRTVRRRRRAVGPQTLVGKTGVVREACKPLGQVFVAGELWGAHCAEGADVGASVKVVAVRDLQLEVRGAS